MPLIRYSLTDSKIATYTHVHKAFLFIAENRSRRKREVEIGMSLRNVARFALAISLGGSARAGGRRWTGPPSARLRASSPRIRPRAARTAS